MPPSSSRLGPSPQAPHACPQPRALASLTRALPVVSAAALALAATGPRSTAAASREIFLTTEPAAADPAAAESSNKTEETGPSEQPESPPPAPAAAPTDPPKPAVIADTDPGPAAPRLGPGGEVRVFGGMHEPTFGVALAFDWAFRRAAIGVQADYSAWLGYDDYSMHPGAIHFAATGQHRIPLGRLSLRQRLAVGPAILLAERGPHRPGSVGLFFEAAPLGLEIHSRISRLTFVFEAFSLALSAPALGPQLVGQVQYRATLGLRF